jgi:hypothetical protein
LIMLITPGILLTPIIMYNKIAYSIRKIFISQKFYYFH